MDHSQIVSFVSSFIANGILSEYRDLVPILPLVECGLAKVGRLDMRLAVGALVVGETRAEDQGQRP